MTRPDAGTKVGLTGTVVEARPGFAVVTVDGAQPPGTYICVGYEALAQIAELPAEPPAKDWSP